MSIPSPTLTKDPAHWGKNVGGDKIKSYIKLQLVIVL